MAVSEEYYYYFCSEKIGQKKKLWTRWFWFEQRMGGTIIKKCSYRKSKCVK